MKLGLAALVPGAMKVLHLKPTMQKRP